MFIVRGRRKTFIETTAKSVIFFLGWALLIGFTPVLEYKNPAIWRFVAELIPFVGVVIVTIIFYFVEKKSVDIKLLYNMKFGSQIGILSGVLWIGLTSIIFFVFGLVEYTSVNKVDMLFIWIVSALLNSAMQELLVRGYLYQLVKYKYNMIISTVVTTMLFTLMHGGAMSAGLVPTLNVITMSVFMTILLEYSNSLLAPILAHSIWNIVGSIILGSVSLSSDYPKLLNMTFIGNELLSGGIYMFEGSVLVLIVNVVFTLFFIRRLFYYE